MSDFQGPHTVTWLMDMRQSRVDGPDGNDVCISVPQSYRTVNKVRPATLI